MQIDTKLLLLCNVALLINDGYLPPENIYISPEDGYMTPDAANLTHNYSYLLPAPHHEALIKSSCRNPG